MASEKMICSVHYPLTQIAFIGNSMLYFNDTPRFLCQLTSVSSKNQFQINQDSCLRGGASFISIYHEGNGMTEKFNTHNAITEHGEFDIGSSDIETLLTSRKTWDFVIMNDFSQAPAREETREDSEEILIERYAPLLKQCKAVPILLMTAAYRAPAKGSEDLGSVEEFTARLYQGYRSYAKALDKALGKRITRIAPVGKAYFIVYQEDQKLWKKLFYQDDFHPSVHGTFLQGCVLHWMIYGKGPDLEDFSSNADFAMLWSDARRHYPPEATDVELEFPSKEEALYLNTAAERAYRHEPSTSLE